MKFVTLPDILTKTQIAHAARLYKSLGMDSVSKIQIEVIEPNMAAINEKLGQENSARVVHVFSQGDHNLRDLRGLSLRNTKGSGS